MIYIGYPNQQKASFVDAYRTEHNIKHAIVIYPERLPQTEYDNVEYIEYQETIMYRTFYRLLQEINNDTLIVIDECLRTQNRYELTYNCIRHYLAQTTHQIIFQRLPQIDIQDDFMILFDFDTQSRWKNSKFDINLILDNAQVKMNPLAVEFTRIDVQTSEKTKAKYQSEKEKRFTELGIKDPHTIPRNLYLIGGIDKLEYIKRHNGNQFSLFDDSENLHKWYVARNKRIKHDAISTYRDFSAENIPVCVIEFPHRFVDFSDFITRSKQYTFDVLVADLKVDDWYWQRYQKWGERINASFASLRQR